MRLEPVISVKQINFTLLKSNPPGLIVEAAGIVPFPVWTDPVLKLQDDSPENGIYEFNFEAKRPEPSGGPVIQPVFTIFAHHQFQTIPDNFRGVIVHAKSNSLEKMYYDTSESLNKAASMSQPQETGQFIVSGEADGVSFDEAFKNAMEKAAEIQPPGMDMFTYYKLIDFRVKQGGFVGLRPRSHITIAVSFG